MNCPNCAAAMESKPCKACGWPDTTHPGQAVLREVAARRKRRERGQVEPTSSCSQGCSLITAVVASLGLGGFWRVGAANNWTSDGPGILLIYMGVGVCGLFAAGAWLGFTYGFVRPYLPRFIREEIEDEGF